MKKTGWTILLATVLSYIPVVGAQEQASEEPFKTADWRKDFSLAIGTKLWFNEWQAWNVEDFIFNPTTAQFEATQNSAHNSDDYEFTPIPVISVKYHDLFVSASYFVNTDYNFPTLNPDVDRKEWDVAVGYYLLPPYLALTVGFKEIQQDFSGLEFKVAGPTVGFVGAVPMKWGFSLYSSFAYGFLEMESEFFENGRNVIDNSGLITGIPGALVIVPGTPGDDDRDAAYWLVEAGVAYTQDLQNLPVNLLLSSATFYAGYRHQQVETDDVGASIDPAFNNTDDDGLDITRGMVIGVNLSF
jgi:hypothetical protein